MFRSIFLKSLVVCAPLWMAVSARCDEGANLIYSRKGDIKDGGHTSPDGKFVVVSHYGEAENIHISLYAKSNPQKVVFQSNSIDGFAWLPGRDHFLVFAVNVDNNGETPGLFLWQGGKRPRLIKGIPRVITGVGGEPLKVPNVTLLGVSHDGHKIAYYYSPNLMDKNKKTSGPFVKSLRLP